MKALKGLSSNNTIDPTISFVKGLMKALVGFKNETTIGDFLASLSLKALSNRLSASTTKKALMVLLRLSPEGPYELRPQENLLFLLLGH